MSTPLNKLPVKIYSRDEAKKATPLKFAIVKYADKLYWETHWDEDPKIGGVIIDDSAYNTPTGKTAGIKLFYNTFKEATADLPKIVKLNPSVGYAVCPVKD